MTKLTEQHPDLATAINLLDKWVARRAYQLHQPGLAVGLVHRGELLWGKGYGLANVEYAEPVTLDTRFRIASITKTFTAVAILQLCEADKLRLDDPVSQYLSWFKLRYDGAPEITIRHLLSHISGLPRDATTPVWTENKFQSWAELVETTQTRQPTMPPAEDHSYSNLGYALLGGVVEVVSGEAWADYIQKHILDPLGMANTLVTPAGDEPNLAAGYQITRENYVREAAPISASNGFSAAFSIASSVNDLVKYMRFHLSMEDTPLLSAYSLREMHRIQWLNKNWQNGYGLGAEVYRINEWIISGHSGGYKGYLTGFYMAREQEFGVIVLTNALESRPFEYVDRAFKLVLPEVLKAFAKPKPEPDPTWQKYVGSYRYDWGDGEVVIRNRQLQLVSLDWLDNPPMTLEPTGEVHVFRIHVPGNPGETARFELDDAGEVTRLWLRNEYAVRKR